MGLVLRALLRIVHSCSSSSFVHVYLLKTTVRKKKKIEDGKKAISHFCIFAYWGVSRLINHKTSICKKEKKKEKGRGSSDRPRVICSWIFVRSFFRRRHHYHRHNQTNELVDRQLSAIEDGKDDDAGAGCGSRGEDVDEDEDDDDDDLCDLISCGGGEPDPLLRTRMPGGVC